MKIEVDALVQCVFHSVIPSEMEYLHLDEDENYEMSICEMIKLLEEH